MNTQDVWKLPKRTTSNNLDLFHVIARYSKTTHGYMQNGIYEDLKLTMCSYVFHGIHDLLIQHFLTGVNQTDAGKMAIWTVGSFHSVGNTWGVLCVYKPISCVLKTCCVFI